MSSRAVRGPSQAITRLFLASGAALAAAAAWLVVVDRPRPAGFAAAGSGLSLLVGGHRANHGAGGPADRMLDALLDRVWDGAVLGSIAWAMRDESPHIAVAALVALGASFLSSYVRARGAALGYTVEESHVTRGLRYALVSFGLATDGLGWALWSSAALSVAAALVRSVQVAKEERL